MKKCPECGSEKIIPDAMVSTSGHKESIRVSTDAVPEAIVFKERQYSTVKAAVCGNCGFTALYAEDPDTLWSAYQRQRNRI